MKSKDFQKKLVLKKTTVVSLEDARLRAIRGGGTKPPTQCDCYSADTFCPTRPGIACTT